MYSMYPFIISFIISANTYLDTYCMQVNTLGTKEVLVNRLDITSLCLSRQSLVEETHDRLSVLSFQLAYVRDDSGNS